MLSTQLVVLSSGQLPTWFTLLQYGLLLTITSASVLALAQSLQKHYKSCQSSTWAIRLPDHEVSRLATRKNAIFDAIRLNIKPVLNVDGDVVDETGFWTRTALARYFAWLISLTALCLQVKAFVDMKPKHDLSMVVTLLVDAIQLVLTSLLAFHPRVSPHTLTLRCSFTLGLLHLIEQYIQHIGPALFDVQPILSRSTQVHMGLTLLLTLTVGFIPQSTGHHLDMADLYNDAIGRTIKTSNQDDPTSARSANVVAENSTSLLTSLFCLWVLPFIRVSSTKAQIDLQDLPACPAHLRMQPFVRNLATAVPPRGVKGLLVSMWTAQRAALVKQIAIHILLIPMFYIPHFSLQHFLYALETRSGMWTGIAWAIVFLSGKLANVVVQLFHRRIGQSNLQPRLQMHSRFLLYGKILTRNLFSNSQIGISSKADILNLISVDTEQLSNITFTGIELFRSQLEMVLGGTYVWMLLGTSGLWGLSTLLITNIPAYYVTQKQYKVFEKRLAISDERVSLMQEAIQAISMIKMIASERFWYRRVSEVREREFREWMKARLLGVVSGLLYGLGPTILLVATFAHYTLVAKQTMTASVAFTSIAVFDELRSVLTSLPENIAQLLQELLSVKRAASFLDSEDLQYLDQSLSTTPSTDNNSALLMRGTLGWTSDGESFQLRNLDLIFPRSKMTLIAGKFGSGKTLMLLGLLGEAALIEGEVTYTVSDVLTDDDKEACGRGDGSLVKGGVAYVPQTAWLQSLSIRENILFGLPLNIERYKKVLHAVCLIPDLAILEDGDLTEIGERGKILSGGQKARVSLARAVYSRASTLILDDVISAVDATTSQHIIEHCFNGEIMAGRTIIIASHAVESLAPIADQAIFLENGQVALSGTGDELLRSEHVAHLRASVEGENISLVDQDRQGKGVVDKDIKEKDQTSTSESADEFQVKEFNPKTPRQILLEDKREEGTVMMKHYSDWLSFNGGAPFWVMWIVLLGLVKAAMLLEYKTLEHWTADTESPQDQGQVMRWVMIYGAFSMGGIVIAQVHDIFAFYGGWRAMRKIHNEMLESVLRAKMSFFTSTRAGSIVQRFSHDLTDVADASQWALQLGHSSIELLVALVAVGVYTGWPFLGATLIFFALFVRPLGWYRSTVRQVRRLQSTIPGPINALYSETIAGSSVIRAFGTQSIMLNELLGTINMSVCALQWRLYISRWMTFVCQMLNLIAIAISMAVILLDGNISAPTAGFIITLAGTMSYNVNEVIVNYRNIELDAINLERTGEYRHLERERGSDRQSLSSDGDGDGDGDSDEDRGIVPKEWPDKGKIQVQDLCASYGVDMPDILHNVSFTVQAGERVGIVGASGCGKSTLAKSLFSFVDVTNGRIVIDGKDIADIPLNRLRSSLGIIAQDPILLSGSLRLNLDIEGKCDDALLYDALRMVQLIRAKTNSQVQDTGTDHVDNPSNGPRDAMLSSIGAVVVDSDLDGGGGGSQSGVTDSTIREDFNVFENLDFQIKTGGENLSAGQKQLIVLARALIKRHRILIMDEATASIDSETDQIISRLIHGDGGFEGCTVIIIAHRLRTIIPCSHIIVMDAGRIVQQGSPLELIRQRDEGDGDGNGKFRELCLAAGEDEFRQLEMMAEVEARKDDGGLVDLD